MHVLQVEVESAPTPADLYPLSEAIADLLIAKGCEGWQVRCRLKETPEAS